MPATLLRSLVFLVPVAAALALGLATQKRQFGWLEGNRADGGYLAVSGAPLATRDGDVLRVTYGEGSLRVNLVFPLQILPAESVPVAIELQDESGTHTGPARLEVQEVGAFVAGRLTAEIDGLRLEGGLRVAPGARPVAVRDAGSIRMAAGAKETAPAQ